MNILAGDIGGTNTRLLFAKMNDTVCDCCYQNTYASPSFNNLTEVIELFLSEYDITEPIDAACFAIAGPVENHSVSVTNLPWVIDEQALKKYFSIPLIILINDFVAVAYGITELKDHDFIVLQNGTNTSQEQNIDAAVVGAGTGFGAAHLIWLDNKFHPYPSEAGHTGFAPENSLQSQLLLWLQTKHSHVSLEMLLSGKGLVNIYHFLLEKTGFKESSIVKNKMKLNDPAEVITEYALSAKDKLCELTVSSFIDIYGAAAGNIALSYYPIGELFIAGGIANKIKNKMQDSSFIDAFVNKGLLSENMKKIKIKLITQDNVGLYGALVKLKLTVNTRNT